MPDTNAIATSLKTFLQAVQYNSAPLYSLVKIGSVTDPTDVVTYASITFDKGMTERYASGWRIDDRPVFLIESGMSMDDSTAAETLLMGIRDLLIPLFLSQVSLNSTPGVYMTLLEQEDRALYKAYPNGRIYRVHHLFVKVAAQYNVTVSG